ncbi:3,4-dihydroxy-2-butanone-4-phosphate synthase [Amycolatopsis thermoflava]
MSTQPGRPVERAVAAIAAGGMVVVVDSHERENEGDLVAAAELITTEQMAFLVRHSTGIVCAPMTAERADTLRLPQMVSDNTDAHGTAFTVSVDHDSTGTGVSAADRTRTFHALAAAATAPGELRRPGHVFPLRARTGGVLARAGHTEAAVDLTTMAGLSGVGVISELVDHDGSMRRGESLAAFAAEHHLPLVTVADIARHRRATESQVELVATTRMPTAYGDFTALAYREVLDGTEHLALVAGDPAVPGALVRMHSECLTGDTLGSLRCDCGTQLQQSLRAIAEAGNGTVIYLRGHEGRGIGLARKICAYALQEQGLDTVDANIAQGLPVDSRSYHIGARILRALGAAQIRLITNNPAKAADLAELGITITEHVALPSLETPHNLRYLTAKRERLGHRLTTIPAGATQGAV